MSYARFSEGDVYLYASDRGFECCACGLGQDAPMQTRVEVVRHLADHMEAGDSMPERIWEVVNDSLAIETEERAVKEGRETMSP